jgi:cation diffusion facilitator family transporter
VTDLAHTHVFLGDDHSRNERRTWLVIAITGVMMVVEIVAGVMFGSMALVADGWHMSTHAGALLIAALAYGYARRHATDARFTFGSGKLGDLAGFASAIVLAVIALLIGWESVLRLFSPVAVQYEQALYVAVIGLAVNLLCAFILREDHGHHHPGQDHDHDHHHDHGHAHPHPHPHPHDHANGAASRDNNLRAAYMHVLADALTSVLAIAALLVGSWTGWTTIDPLIGILGAVVIARWSWSLLRDAGRVLLDVVPDGAALDAIRNAVERDGDEVTDLHLWQVGPGHRAAIVVVTSSTPRPPADYKARLARFNWLSHMTVEVVGRDTA